MAMKLSSLENFRALKASNLMTGTMWVDMVYIGNSMLDVAVRKATNQFVEELLLRAVSALKLEFIINPPKKINKMKQNIMSFLRICNSNHLKSELIFIILMNLIIILNNQIQIHF